MRRPSSDDDVHACVECVVDWFAPVRARPRVVYRREWCMWFILYMVWCGVLEWYERGESGWTCLVRFFYKSKLRLNVGNRGLAVAESNWIQPSVEIWFQSVG